jgi:ParB family transcriptional regulator, chromosome partitioning protein
MSVSEVRQERFHGLDSIPVDRIDPNPENPRMIFPQEELDRLAESIDKEGILVPIVVYPEGDRFVLIDGERRLRCALELGLKNVPAVITQKANRLENLLQMFNIHLVREPWQDMPTAAALQKLMEETKATGDRELSDLTGLSTERIKRLKHALELPSEYQAYIRDGTIPLNWFWELKRNVIEPMARNRPQIFKDYGEPKITTAFVKKRLAGQAVDTVALRDVRPILTLAAKDAGDPDKASVLDETIRRLVEDPELSISQAYEDTVQIVVEADKLEGRTENMLKSFQRLLGKVRNDDERNMVVGVGQRFLRTLADLLGL